MHSVIIAAIAGIVAASTMAGFGSSVWINVSILSLGVAILGVPHGALDPIFGKRMFEALHRLWWIPFFLLYGLASAMVVGSWYLEPVLTCCLFFAFAAWHFGLEEDYGFPSNNAMLEQLFAFGRGAGLIVAIVVARSQQTEAILAQVIPVNGTENATRIVTAVTYGALFLVPLFLVDLVGWLLKSVDSTLVRLIRILSLFVVAITVDPLLSFAIYFCGWHSVRGLVELRSAVPGEIAHFAKRLAPISCVTILLGVAGYLLWASADAPGAALIRTLFVGLSAIAIPHLALHGIFRWWEANVRHQSPKIELVPCN